MSNWFSEGYEKVEERQQQIDEQLSRTFMPDLIIKEDDEDAVIRFITFKPFNFYEHFLPNLKRSFTCPDGGDSTKGNCPLCATGNKASFRSAYLVADHRHEEWEDRQGKKQSRQNTVKVAKYGVKVARALGKQHEKLIKKGNPNGLLDVDFEVTRTGTGTDTMYNFVPISKNPAFAIPEMKDTPQNLLMEAIKPKSREDLLKVIGGGGNTGAGAGGGTAYKPQRIDISDDDNVIKFD